MAVTPTPILPPEQNNFTCIFIRIALYAPPRSLPFIIAIKSDQFSLPISEGLFLKFDFIFKRCAISLFIVGYFSDVYDGGHCACLRQYCVQRFVAEQSRQSGRAISTVNEMKCNVM